MSTNNNLAQEYHQIFISYTHEDSNAANRLFRDLKEFEKEFKLKIWLDKERLLPGQSWAEVIQNVIKESKYFILLLSKNAIEKNTYVQEELGLALEKADQQQAEIYIIPIRLDNCEISESIQKLHVVDLFPDWKYGFEKILLAMGISAKPKRLADIQWENLLDAIDRKSCIPFIGSSALEFYNKIDNDAFLTKNELAKEWAKEYDYPFQGPYELPKVSQYVAITELGNAMAAKENVSRRFRRMTPPNFRSDKFSKSPHAILAELNLPIYITTNYDFFMEEALQSQGKQPRSGICKWNQEVREIVDEETEQDPFRPTSKEPLVFHFHGTIDLPESLVLTERDHQDFIINTNKESEKAMLPTYLRRALPTSTLLFIGYSLGDINFRSIFQGALSFMSPIRKRKNSIAVIEIPIENDSVKREILTKYMEKYTNHMFEIVIYWGELNEFLEELQTKWREYNNKILG
jgi:hypothetical protein